MLIMIYNVLQWAAIPLPMHKYIQNVLCKEPLHCRMGMCTCIRHIKDCCYVVHATSTVDFNYFFCFLSTFLWSFRLSEQMGKAKMKKGNRVALVCLFGKSEVAIRFEAWSSNGMIYWLIKWSCELSFRISCLVDFSWLKNPFFWPFFLRFSQLVFRELTIS